MNGDLDDESCGNRKESESGILERLQNRLRQNASRIEDLMGRQRKIIALIEDAQANPEHVHIFERYDEIL